MLRSCIFLMGAVLICCVMVAQSPASIVLNGGFETGDFTDWTPWGNLRTVSLVFIRMGTLWVTPWVTLSFTLFIAEHTALFLERATMRANSAECSKPLPQLRDKNIC